MKFRPEQLNTEAPPPIKETAEAVHYLGVEIKKGNGGEHTPNIERFQEDVITDYDLELMQKIAVGVALNQPVLVEGGSGIGKSQTVDRMCAELNRESYYANCHDYDADTLIGAPTHKEDTKSGFGWKDGVIIQAARKGGVLFLDEYNFMRGDTRGRLHEVLDSILRGRGEISLTENNNEIVKVHPEFRIIAAQNPPGGEYGDREVLDPAQIDRFVYIKEPMKLPQEVRTARLLGKMGMDNKITVPKESYLTKGERLSPQEVANIPGIEELMKKYVEVSDALQNEVENRTIARGASQPIAFGTQRDDKRIFEFIQNFYHGDINKTFQDALRYYCKNKVLDEVDRDKIESLIDQVKYVPPVNTKRQAPRAAQAVPGTPPPIPDDSPELSAPESREIRTSLEKAEKIMTNEGREKGNFLGPKAVKEAFGIGIPSSEVPPIQFTEAELEQARKLGQRLILRDDKTSIGKPLSMKEINEELAKKWEKAGKGGVLNSADGWRGVFPDYFDKQAPKKGWALVSKEVIPNSTNKNYLEQTEVMIKYLKEEVFKGKPLPEEYKEAIKEFESKKSSLSELMDSDWKKAAKELSTLKITQLTRASAVEAIYDLTLAYSATGKRELSDKYTWTKALSSGGYLVYVGSFDEGGVGGGHWKPGHRYGYIGVSLSRS